MSNLQPGSYLAWAEAVDPTPGCRYCGTKGNHYCPNDVDTYDTDPEEVAKWKTEEEAP